ncbi:SMC-Scp complex subunit ScpB [Coxiella endosymbiont of Dermacentor marginatus]
MSFLLETLAFITCHQPILREEIEAICRVMISSDIMQQLLD